MEYQGKDYLAEIRIGTVKVLSEIPAHWNFKVGQEIHIRIEPCAIRLYDKGLA